MLELYHHGNSVCAQRVRLVLEEKGLAWRERFVDIFAGQQHQPDYLKLNPRGVVPTLVHDGRAIRESTVICEYLEEAFPQRPLRPAEPYARAQMRLWTKLPDESIHAACAAVTFSTYFRYAVIKRTPAEVAAMAPEEFRQVAEQSFHPAMLKRRQDWIIHGLRAPDVTGLLRSYDKMLADMEGVLTRCRWLLGEDYSLADIAMIPYVDRLARLGLEGLWRPARPHLTRWYEAVRERPNYAAAIGRWLTEDEAAAMASVGRQSWPEVQRLLAT
ncbi:MAG TPA: glutathione S-transferase family protein [Candidatus Binataceae bacterium]|nr:glutathione S-transferase family protein [Candidatus Binataceae bacterium]